MAVKKHRTPGKGSRERKQERKWKAVVEQNKSSGAIIFRCSGGRTEIEKTNSEVEAEETIMGDQELYRDFVEGISGNIKS